MKYNKINKIFYEDQKKFHKETKEYRWWHKIKLPDGSTTPGLDQNEARWEGMVNDMPSFKNKTVLDVGAWDGYFSFKAESLGASRVLAVDHFCWSGPGWGNKNGFNYAHEALNSKVESLDIDIPDISAESVGMFDIVMMFGVLYHLPSIFTSFVNIASCAKKYFLVETLVDLEIQQDVPLLRFFPFDECYDDPTNWFAPNPKAVVSMMEYCGFTNVNQKILSPKIRNHWARAYFFGQKTNHELT